MAALSQSALPALAALVNATVFSSGFLSTRVHRERGRALDRVLAIDERLGEDQVESSSRVDRNQPRRLGIPLHLLDEQREVIRQTREDRLVFGVAAMNVGLALAVCLLAYEFGRDAQLPPGKWLSSPEGWAFAGRLLGRVAHSHRRRSRCCPRPEVSPAAT